MNRNLKRLLLLLLQNPIRLQSLYQIFIKLIYLFLVVLYHPEEFSYFKILIFDVLYYFGYFCKCAAERIVGEVYESGFLEGFDHVKGHEVFAYILDVIILILFSTFRTFNNIIPIKMINSIRTDVMPTYQHIGNMIIVIKRNIANRALQEG